MREKVRIKPQKEEEKLNLEDVELPPITFSMGKLLVLEACQETKTKREIEDLSGFSFTHIVQNVLPEYKEHNLIKKTDKGFKTTSKGFKVKKKVMQYRDYELNFVKEDTNKEYQDIVG